MVLHCENSHDCMRILVVMLNGTKMSSWCSVSVANSFQMNNVSIIIFNVKENRVPPGADTMVTGHDCS